MIRTTIGSIGVCAILVSCGSGNGTESAAPEEPTTTAATMNSSNDGSALQGTWRTNPISVDAAEATLREHDLAKWIKRFRPLAPFADGDVLILEIGDGKWDLYGKSKGGARQKIDYDADYEVDESRVVVSHEDDSNVYLWSVDGDTLTLEWLDTTYPGYKGIPEEAFQVALYMTEAFNRQ